MRESRVFTTKPAAGSNEIPRTSYRLDSDSQKNEYIIFDAPFYRWSLLIESGDRAVLAVDPKTRYDSNRYHTLRTPDGTILSERGRRRYRIGYSTLTPNEFESVTFLESTPHRGRRITDKSASAELGTVEIALYDDFPITPLQPTRKRRKASPAQLIKFLQLAAEYKNDV